LAQSPIQIVEELNRIRRQSGVFLTVDTFDRLMASGRIGRQKAWLARALRIKPVFWVPTDGRAIEPLGRALGRKRVLPVVMEALRKKLPSRVDRIRFGIPHVGYPEIVEEVSAAIRAEYGDVEILSAPASPVIATHTGIGAWGLAFLLED
jgi:DegV family protein with EDD domain